MSALLQGHPQFLQSTRFRVGGRKNSVEHQMNTNMKSPNDKELPSAPVPSPVKTATKPTSVPPSVQKPIVAPLKQTPPERPPISPVRHLEVIFERVTPLERADFIQCAIRNCAIEVADKTEFKQRIDRWLKYFVHEIKPKSAVQPPTVNS
jgi:hypothetical protein